MPRKRYSTTQPTALSSAATNSDTTLYVVDGSTFPDPNVGGNGPYTVLVGYQTSREEICTVTAKPGTNILTVTRGEDGSSATSKNIGDVVVHGASKRDWDDIEARTITAGYGLTGGGDLTASRTLALDTSVLYGRRNRIINGGFDVNQRGFTSTTTTGTYGLDRWLLNYAGGTVTYSAQAPAVGDLPESARAFARLAVSGQSAAGDNAYLAQRIESVRTLSGKTVTVSFWAKAASGTPKVAVELRQAFGSGGSTTVDTYAGQVTLSTSWTRYSVTVAVPSIAGKTVGSGSDDFLGLHLWTSAGSTFNARTGTLGTQAATIDFWGVQVEEGSVATPFEHCSYADELRDCQRYFRSFLGSPSADYVALAHTGIYADANSISMALNGWSVRDMRSSSPAVSASGIQGTDWGVFTSGGAYQTGFSLPSTVTSNGLVIMTKTAHGLTAGGTALRVSTSSGRINFDAEL